MGWTRGVALDKGVRLPLLLPLLRFVPTKENLALATTFGISIDEGG